MQCASCAERAVIERPARCREHFLTGFVRNVWDTVERFSLIPQDARVCVAASGGKDSLALLHVLHKRYAVEALAVDEGIPGYRDKTLHDLRTYCAAHEIPLRIVSFTDIGAKPLAEQDSTHPCSVCGVLRRKALLQYAAEYDVLATGHNLDDEAQTVLMNVLRNQQGLLARTGPRVTGPGLPARVKPFFLTPEREIRAYCVLHDIPAQFAECPFVVRSFRWKVGEALRDLECARPGSTRNIVEQFLQDWTARAGAADRCARCGLPASAGLCRACALLATGQTSFP